LSTKKRQRGPRPPASLLFADDQGRFFDHPDLLAVGQAWQELQPLPPGILCHEPEGMDVVFLPGRRPVGLDPDTGVPVVLEEVEMDGSLMVPHAVAATVPPGYLRFAMPAMRAESTPPTLPLRAYTAVAWSAGRIGLAAQRIDPHKHWDPARFPHQKVQAAVLQGLQKLPGNKLVEQIAHCARDYACCTASNFFLGTTEAALPVAPTCNARCLGCISEQEEAPSPQLRIERPALVEHVVQAALFHLNRVESGMVSFGQGCEGEPLTQAERIKEAIFAIREKTDRGGVHMNTNGSRPSELAGLVEAGLQSVRVSLFSARQAAFDAYHRADFGLDQVEQFVREAVERGLVVSVNYLVVPGYHDREEEREAFAGFLARTGAHMVQLRNLDMDPDRLFEALVPPEGHAVGLRKLPEWLRKQRPGLRTGSFNPLPDSWAELRSP